MKFVWAALCGAAFAVDDHGRQRQHQPGAAEPDASAERRDARESDERERELNSPAKCERGDRRGDQESRADEDPRPELAHEIEALDAARELKHLSSMRRSIPWNPARDVPRHSR